MDKYIGKLLDNRYEILEVIGTGGMAVVYKALCHRLNRFVAVKLLKEEHLRDEDFRRRFHDEAQAVAMLSHPNIVSVYDVSSSPGAEYFVMELIDGVTLKEYMKRKGILTWKEVLYFTTQTANALGHAHSRGIIHRDIKPHNIMILRDGTIKVADFGIARLIMQKQNSLMQEALGSVHYVAPEQAKGSYIDARADIYSLGVVMYEMLTGRLPFEGDTPVSVAMQHIHAVPLMPREINPSIPVGMEEMTMKAMNPSLDSRYASAYELISDLEKFRANPDIVFGYKAHSNMEDEDEFGINSEKTVKLTGIPEKLSEYERNGAVRRSSSDMTKRTQVSRNRRKSDGRNSRREDKEFNRSAVVAAGVVSLFIFGALFFVWSIFGMGRGKVESAQIPRLTGMLLEEVLANTEYTENFNIVQSAQMYHDTMPDGTIMQQSPEAGRAAKKGDTISVTVSRGKKTMSLTDLRNFEYRQAMLALSRADLLYKEQYETSDTVQAGYVITTDPEPTSTVSEGDIITLIISQGKVAETAKVPYVVGMTEMNARLTLENAGLVVGVITPVESKKNEGIVLSQGIKEGETVDQKTAVDLTVSISAAPPTTNSEEPTREEPTSKNTQKPTQNNNGNTSGTQNNSPTADEIKTYNLPVNLERFSGQVRVTVKFNGEIVFDEIKDADKEKLFFVTLRGKDTGYVYLYVDNQNIADHMVTFD